MEHICEFCNKNFKNKYILSNHIKTTKSCSGIKENKINFVCTFCQKTFTSKHKLKDHIKKCNEYIIMNETQIMKNKIEEQNLIIKQKDEDIADLKLKIEELHKKIINLCEKVIEMK
jgi:hypothetical protein